MKPQMAPGVAICVSQRVAGHYVSAPALFGGSSLWAPWCRKLLGTPLRYKDGNGGVRADPKLAVSVFQKEAPARAHDVCWRFQFGRPNENPPRRLEDNPPKAIGMEDPQPIVHSFGCIHEQFAETSTDGTVATGIRYNAESFLRCCCAEYKALHNR